jgi:palmitoyltransferase
MAPGMLQMDVHAAAWSWIVVLTSGAGMYFMYRVSYADPGFLDVRGDEGVGVEPASPGASKFRNDGYGRVSSSVPDGHHGAVLNHPELWAGNWNSMCTTCGIIKPWGAKHCGVSNSFLNVPLHGHFE